MAFIHEECDEEFEVKSILRHFFTSIERKVPTLFLTTQTFKSLQYKCIQIYFYLIFYK